MTDSTTVGVGASGARRESVRAALLEVEGLQVAFPTAAGVAFAVAGVTFAVHAGECLGIVGESGSGKSMTCRSMLGLVPSPGAIVRSQIRSPSPRR